MTITAPTLLQVPGGRTKTVQLEDTSHHVRVTAPLLKWPGGKGGELAKILPLVPSEFDRYFEPFVGGGAVFFAMPPDVPAYINDASTDLMDFYRCVHEQNDDLFAYLLAIDRWWKALHHFTQDRGHNLVDFFLTLSSRETPAESYAGKIIQSLLESLLATVPLEWGSLKREFGLLASKLVPKKVARMRSVEVSRAQRLPLGDVWSNIEGAFKAACYTVLRGSYNERRLVREQSPRQSALFFFMREYAYAAMFRYNDRGEFNVPYGGITYNNKNFASKIEHLRSPDVACRLETTVLGNESFETFLTAHTPGPRDFMFLDPPYDSDFSDYDHSGFSKRDHQLLASTMKSMDCKFQLVIKSTPTVRWLYDDERWNIVAFNKKYMWTIKERNDRNATHLMITNY